MIHFSSIPFLSILLAFLAVHSPGAESPKEKGDSLRARDIFRETNTWTAHLSFTPAQWKAMEPKQGARNERQAGKSFLQGVDGGRNGISAALGVVFDYVRADLEFGTNLFKDVGVRYKGNGTFLSSQESLKRSLKVDLNQFVKGQKLAGMSQINLHNSVRDPSFMNEAVAYRLFREGGVPAPRTAYAKVFITVPGIHDRKYFGLYTLVEDIDNHFAEEHFGSSKGAILKPVTPNLFSDLGDDWKNYNQTYDPKGNLSDEQKRRVIEFCKFATASDDAGFATRLADYIDIDNFARYMAITAWLSDLDGILGPGQNYYVYLHPKTQKFLFIPWDQDQTLGQFPRGSEDQRENLSIKKPWTGENRFLEKVFKAESFKKAYLGKLEEFGKTIFRPEPIHRQVDELASVLRAPAGEESPEKLAELNKAAAGEKITVSTMGPGGARESLVKPIKAFVDARAKAVSDQVAGKSNGQTIEAGLGGGSRAR